MVDLQGAKKHLSILLFVNKVAGGSHNLHYSMPLTGNPEIDKVNNRTKRIFNDKTGRKAAKKLEPILLQTYTRDAGEIMHDISVPIHGERSPFVTKKY